MKLLSAFAPGIIFVAMSLNSCENRKPNQEKSDIIRREVEAMINAYCEDVNKLGLIAEFKYLDSTEEFRWRPPGYDSLLDYHSIAAIIRKNAPALKSVLNTYDSLIVKPIDNDHAAYSAVVNSRVVDSGGKVTRMILSETGTAIKRSDGWKLLTGETHVLHF